MNNLDKRIVDAIIRFALKEDIGTGDITSQSIVDRFLSSEATIISKEEGTVCGMNIIERVFASVEYTLKFQPLVKDGSLINSGQEIAFVSGNAQSILKAERVALNFLSLLSGVATRTRKLIDKVKNTNVKIYDTRKTIPLHRHLQKYAVTVGGGYNHRMGLWDMVIIKDNHLRSLTQQLAPSDSMNIIKESIKRARESVQKNIRIEIEVETLKECEHALKSRPDVIMLDNMPVEAVREAVSLRKKMQMDGKVLYEVSGGINEETIEEYAKTGVEIISIGALTNSIKPIDFSLEIVLRGE